MCEPKSLIALLISYHTCISVASAPQRWPDVGTDVHNMNGPLQVQFHTNVQISSGLMWEACIGPMA